MVITYTQDGYSYPAITAVKNGFSVGFQKVKKLEDAIAIAEKVKFRF
jgi:hypothetical protein